MLTLPLWGVCKLKYKLAISHETPHNSWKIMLQTYFYECIEGCPDKLHILEFLEGMSSNRFLFNDKYGEISKTFFKWSLI